MSAIGILGGMGPQASARLYELLIAGTKAYIPSAIDSDYPEIVLLSVPIPNFISNKNDLEKAKQMLIARTLLLEEAGSIVNGMVCNTAHILLPHLEPITKVPFLSIPDLAAKEVKHRGYERVGLLGSPTTLSSNLYDNALNNIATVVKPRKKAAKQAEGYIYKQLQNNIKSTDTQAFRKLVKDFKQSENLDAVILGCTELPLVYGKASNDVIDTLQLLSDGLLEAYFKHSMV
ncbi:MAG: amino acid racemase [Candidatus Paceibacterota bacterium]|jgi:aspartate racemase